MNLSAVASTINVSPSLPRSTIAGGGGAETMVSSFGQATVSSMRRSMKKLAGTMLIVSHTGLAVHLLTSGGTAVSAGAASAGVAAGGDRAY
ncbi:MAG TPA: hypothetical protein VER12_07390 [Polyangiaceae bacterium]|nr:hypothetical protein [Polyangiaceae bacterium]